MIRRPPRSTQSRSSAASDVYKRQEKGNLQVWTFCSDVTRSQPKVVVMYPHRCAFGSFGACRHSKTFVDLFKNLPVCVIYIEIGWKRMKNWPEAFFGCDVIKTGYLFIFQGDSAQSERRRIIHLKPFCTFIRLIVDPSPGNPRAFFAATEEVAKGWNCLLYTSPSPRDLSTSRMPSSA